MKTSKILTILILDILVVSGFACGGGPEATPTPTVTPTPTQTPTIYEADRDAVQTAIDGYYAEHGQWPTSDGEPGDINWEKLVPSFLDSIPATDGNCDWGVNSDPEGDVCGAWTGCACHCPGIPRCP